MIALWEDILAAIVEPDKDEQRSPQIASTRCGLLLAFLKLDLLSKR